MTQSINRRKFLGNAAVTSAAAGLAASGLKTAMAADPSNRIVVGLMGANRGAALATGFSKQPGVEIKYVCDIDSDRANSCANAVAQSAGNKPQAIGDFRRILDDKEVDLLVCAAPNHWHAPATIMACAAGKHVYVEKPCSHNPREGELMVEAARKHNRAVQLGTQRRSGSGFHQAAQQLREGAIGRVYLVRSWYASARGSIGIGKPADVPERIDYELWQGPAPRTPYKNNVVHYNWHWRWMWGNGELGNNGVHTLDLCRWLLDVDFPTRVTSSGGRYAFQDDQETPDTHTVAFEFDDRCQITWQGNSCNRHDNKGFITCYGDNGSMDLGQDGSYVIFDKGDKKIAEHKPPSRGDAEHMANLLAAIRNDEPLNLNAEIAEGHKSTLLCHLGNIAHRTGRSLQCDTSNGHILNDPEAMAMWARDYEPGWEPNV